jgi:hypothetical protein
MTWYLNVKSREELSDCSLDVKFGTGPHQEKRNTATRVKVFEAIRMNGSIPSQGNTGKRGFDLVAYVDSHEKYAGTASILNSPFWKLMETKRLDLNEIRHIVIECVKLLELANQPGELEDDGRDYFREYVAENPDLTMQEYLEFHQSNNEYYDMAMGFAFGGVSPNLDYIALIGALTLEAIEANNLKIAAYHLKIFDSLLEMFCFKPWLKGIGNQLYDYGIERMTKAIKSNALKNLPDYTSMLKMYSKTNMKSPIVAFLNLHQRVLWRVSNQA